MNLGSVDCASCGFSTGNPNPVQTPAPQQVTPPQLSQGGVPQFQPPPNPPLGQITYPAQPQQAQYPTPNQTPGGSNSGFPKIALFILIGVVSLAVLVVVGILLLRLLTGVNTDEALKTVGMECEMPAEEYLDGIELPELAEVIERGHVCELEYDDGYVGEYIRVSEKDYGIMLDAIEKDFKAKAQSEDREMQRAATRIRTTCKAAEYSIGRYETIEDHGLIVGEYVFLSRYFSNFAEKIAEEGLEAKSTQSLCAGLAEIDPDPPEPVLVSSDGAHHLVDGYPEYDLLPVLPIPATDYVFLDGWQNLPSESLSGLFPNCWNITYEIAFKGEWAENNLDTIFIDEDFFDAIERGARELYPEEDPEGFSISFEIYRYNGKDSQYSGSGDTFERNYEPIYEDRESMQGAYGEITRSTPTKGEGFFYERRGCSLAE